VINKGHRMNCVKYLIAICVCFVFLSAHGQKENFFSEDPVLFLSEIEGFLNQTIGKRQLDMTAALMPSFKKNWNSNRFTEAEKFIIIEVANKMYQEKYRNHPHLFDYLSIVDGFGRSNQSKDSFLEWNSYLLRLLNSRFTKEFENLLEQSGQLISKGRIAGKGTANWYIRDADFEFFADTSLILIAQKATVICATNRDSLVLYQTGGVFNYATQVWSGKGGSVDWQRFGSGKKNINVQLSNYEIDLNRPVLLADSVVFRNPDYFNFPLLGSFQDQVFNSPPNDRTQFPRFSSYMTDYEVDNIFPDVNYVGGITVEGLNLLGRGSGSQKATLNFIKDKKTVASVKSAFFLLNKKRIQSENASASFYLDQDSIYHPGLWFRFDNESRMLSLARSDKGIGDGPFLDTYHKVDIFIEAAYWDVEENEVVFKQQEGLAKSSLGSVESSSFFSDVEFRRLQGIDELNPMYSINNFIHEFDTKGEVKVGFLAAYMKKPPEQIVAQLLRLASRGFLIYDSESETAFVHERFRNIIDAKAGKSDYDVIRFNTFTTGQIPNLQLNLKSFDLKINGVDEVILSETQGVQLFPEGKEIILKKNRDFIFKGMVKAGLFNFYAREAAFEYDPFKLNFTFVDSLSFFVKRRDQPLNIPNPEFVRVKNVLSDLTGTLFVDDPNNKSGLKNIPRYPVFTSTSESYVYYDNADIQSGALDRERFFYVVDPFEIDSLDNFSTDNLRFGGYLTSAEIFPIFREPLAVMKDYSLGFDHRVPEEGYSMFGDKALYYNTINLSNDGFFGLGQLDYLTGKAFSKRFVFYPDSVLAFLDKFEMKEKDISVEFPSGVGEKLDFDWQVDSDVVSLKTISDAYNIYGDTYFSGNIEISPIGMYAAGELVFGKSNVESANFEFFSRSFTADTADFRLFPLQGDKEAFMANDYNTFVDFNKRIANFSHIDQKSKLSFPFNQYYCTLDQAIWYMDENRISLNNNQIERIHDFQKLSLNDLLDLDLKGSEFVSEHPQQDSLSFFCLEADYDLNEYAILAKDVKIIRVADAAIFPNDGLVTILNDAQMKPFESATIITDTASRFHTISDAKVSIESSKRFRASGKYNYINTNQEIFVLNLNEISVNDSDFTEAKGLIRPEDSFYLSPWFGFAGEVILTADQKNLRFKGGFRLTHNCFEDEQPWVVFDTVIDPLNVRIPIAEKSFDISGARVNNGFYYATVNDSYYAAFMQSPRGSDKEITSISGLLSYDKISSTYKVGDEAASQNKKFIQLNTVRCLIQGKSELDLDLRLGAVELATIGSFEYKVIPDSVEINVFASLNFLFDDKLTGMMADSLNAANAPGINLNQGNYPLAINRILGQEEAERITNEIALYGAPRRVPEALQKTIAISDLKLKWSPELKSFISYGSIGISNINRTPVNKFFDGFFEIEKSRAGDGITMYLMLNAKQWYFFNYRNGVMQALSSSDVFNTELMKIKQDKRVQSDPKTGGRYEYIISTRRRMVDFLRKMQSM
jgi:hypothetical protein